MLKKLSDLYKMEVTTSETSEEVRVSVSGDLDLSSVASFRNAIDKALAIRDARKLVVDLCNTNYIDSAGLEQLLVANRKLSAEGGRLLVRVESGHQPHTVLSVTGFNAIMDVEPSNDT